MVESQPGTVTTFDPSLTLSSFSASTRDRFMFNENQLVLAKVVRPLASYASSYSGNPVTISGKKYFIPTYYVQYKNSDGEYVYVDDLFYLSNATGVPTKDVHGIIVGYDFQISTDRVRFWSTSFVNTTYLSVDYSFDNNTWFTVGTVTWSYVFDDSLELYEGEVPASGQYEITGIFSSATVGRYWRIKTQGQTTVVSSTSTVVTVVSTNGFTSTGSISTVSISSGSENEIKQSLTYTGKTSTTFTGVTGSTATPGMIVFLEEDLAPTLNNVTEVRVIQATEPILEHWNSDGSQAVSVVVEGSQYFDICYDKFDDVYYAIYFNEEPTQTGAIAVTDNFNADFGSSFDTEKWLESSDFPFFVHNVPSGTLDMVSAGGGGLLTGNYSLGGNFIINMEFVGAFTTNSGTAFSISTEDFDSGNQYMVSSFKGAYVPPSTNQAQFGGAVINYSDTMGGAAVLKDFRIRPQFFDFDYPPGVVQYDMIYNASLDNYAVTVSGATYPSATPGIPYTGVSSAGFTISNVFTPSDGQGFTVLATCDSTSVAGTLASGIHLELERAGTNAYVRYEGTTGGLQTLFTGNIVTDKLRTFIYGHPGSAVPNLRTDNFVVTGGSVSFDTPVFSVVSINKDGNLTQVGGVTDADGFAIKNFDIIRDTQAKYNEFIYPFVSIATNGAAEGSGGEIYIKVGDALYKYLKTSFPITYEASNAPTASITSQGEIPEDGITAFAYNGFTQAGLSYLKYENSLSGVFLKTIQTTTLLASAYKAKLDVATISMPFAWNVSDLSTLYYVDDDELMLYDLNETKAAFVNVTSNKQVLAAGTGETATITAQVLNVYGIPKSAKSMTFSISAGDGAVAPATGCSNVSGNDTTVYTVGASVGTATITVSVSDTTCVP